MMEWVTNVSCYLKAFLRAVVSIRIVNCLQIKLPLLANHLLQLLLRYKFPGGRPVRPMPRMCYVVFSSVVCAGSRIAFCDMCVILVLFLCFIVIVMCVLTPWIINFGSRSCIYYFACVSVPVLLFWCHGVLCFPVP